MFGASVVLLLTLFHVRHYTRKHATHLFVLSYMCVITALDSEVCQDKVHGIMILRMKKNKYGGSDGGTRF
jgi:hypothetical protein